MISRRDQVGTRERRDRLRLTFAYRSYSRTFALPRAAFVISILALPLAGVLYLAATCYFIFHDNMLASLTRHQVEMRYAYEDRIAALRRDLENVTQHAQADQADLADRFRTLSQREDQVESRTALVAALADRIKRMRVPAATSEAISSLSTEPAQSAVTSSSAADVTFARPPLDGKPHPEGFVLSLRRTSGDTLSGPNIPQGSASAAMSPIDFETDLPIATRLDDLVDRYDRVDRQDLIILADLQQPANRIQDGFAPRSLQRGWLPIASLRWDTASSERKIPPPARPAVHSFLCRSYPTAHPSRARLDACKTRLTRPISCAACYRMSRWQRRFQAIRKSPPPSGRGLTRFSAGQPSIRA